MFFVLILGAGLGLYRFARYTGRDPVMVGFGTDALRMYLWIFREVFPGGRQPDDQDLICIDILDRQLHCLSR
jgi:hypothetical protein